MKTAIVILNYNGAQMLCDFLPRVVEYSPDAEVVVADNCSTDNSLNILQEQFPQVRIIALQENYGFAEGYNRALKEVDAEYFMLLNSDVEVTPGWLQPLVDALDADESIAACQPKLLSYRQRTGFEYAGAAGGFIDRYGYPFCRGRIFDTVEEDAAQYDTPCDIFWASGAALMIRSADFFAVGGFDGRFFAHCEEIDLCWRLRARGRRVLSLPASKVYHVGGATLSYGSPRKTFLNFRNNLLMLYKNLPDEELAGVMRMRCLLDYVAAVKFLLTGSFGEFKAVLKARCEYKRMKKEYIEVRKENIAATTNRNIAERMPFMLLWRYYAKGQKRYTNIVKE